MDLEKFKGSITTLVILAVLIAAFVLALDGFQDSLEGSDVCDAEGGVTGVFNSTQGICVNTTNHAQALGGTNIQYNVSQEGLIGVGNASSYLSTIGTLLGVAALITIVVGAFYFARK